MLTPLPGSQDHARMVRAGEYMDPDLNKFDSFMKPRGIRILLPASGMPHTGKRG